MRIHYNVTGEQRKALVKVIAERERFERALG